jgi:hypothetical protein
MSQGRRISPLVTIVSAGSMTGTSVITSSTFDTTNLDNISILMKWTGTPNGTFLVKGSTDGTTFENLAPTAVDGSALTATGSAGNHTVNLTNWGGKAIQVIYTNSSSTGTLTVSVFAKGY